MRGMKPCVHSRGLDGNDEPEPESETAGPRVAVGEFLPLAVTHQGVVMERPSGVTGDGQPARSPPMTLRENAAPQVFCSA